MQDQIDVVEPTLKNVTLPGRIDIIHGMEIQGPPYTLYHVPDYGAIGCAPILDYPDAR